LIGDYTDGRPPSGDPWGLGLVRSNSPSWRFNDVYYICSPWYLPPLSYPRVVCGQPLPLAHPTRFTYYLPPTQFLRILQTKDSA